jgi:hypothetical protein
VTALPYSRFAGIAAILAGIGGLLYSLDFTAYALGIRPSAPELGAFLLVGGVLTSAVFVALFDRLRGTDATFAGFALLLGVIAALGSALHGGYDLANALHPEVFGRAGVPADVPSQVDPRGLATFGISGVALLLFSWLIVRSTVLPKRLGYLGYLLGALLVVIYLGRLIVLHPAPLLVPAAVTGLIVNPAWYIWLGLALRSPSLVRTRVSASGA